jgi:hypothetical protein
VSVRLPDVWEDTVPPPALCAAPAGGGAAGPLRPGRPGGAGIRAALLLRLCRAAAAGHAPGTGGQQTFTHLRRGEYNTDKKENQIFLIYKEIQSGAVAKSYMTNGLLIYGEIFAHFLIY